MTSTSDTGLPESSLETVKHYTPNILLINPWIHDFAAYDFWSKPLGILYLASILRYHGFNVSYVDCLDRFHPKAGCLDPNARYGRGPYLKTKIPTPKGLEDVPRNFSRYGIEPSWFREDLLTISRPDLILVTSLMTYWYPGVQETIGVLKDTFPDVPVVLGGIYATLCRDHAVKNSNADSVVEGMVEGNILKLAGDYTGYQVKMKFEPDDLDTYPYPAFDLQRKISYVPLLTSKGCPFSCAYCASHFLHPERRLRSPASVMDEITYWHQTYDICDFVLYDDAFLTDAEKHAIPLLEKIIDSGLNLRFHTPNAIHIRGLTTHIARLLFQAGFKTLRLGLETSAFDNRKDLDSKVTEEEFAEAMVCFKEAGFKKDQIWAYLLAGLPDQTMASVEESIDIVRQNRITPVLAYYSPIPHTVLWERAVAASRYDLESDPIFTNNAVFPCQKDPFSWDTLTRLKDVVSGG
ncbi:MAG: radical SAM protein [Deltaproteobacteria bacterium]|nr:radical SAM protein [Deltaproteobacteria bacterium]